MWLMAEEEEEKTYFFLSQSESLWNHFNVIWVEKKNEKMGWKAEGNECSANKANYVGMTTMYSENAKKV